MFSSTDDLPEDWEPITVIWGRSCLYQLGTTQPDRHCDQKSDSTYDIVGHTDRCKDILQLPESVTYRLSSITRRAELHTLLTSEIKL